METVINVELRNETCYPDERILKALLGKSYRAYQELLKLFDKNEMFYEWKYYRDGKAWLCKVQRKKKTIVWMSAWKGYMNAAIYIPEKLIENVYKLEISDDTKKKIKMTKSIGKSKPCTFDIRGKKDLRDLEIVMLFKIQLK